MGGLGSGNFLERKKKATVEQSLGLAIGKFRGSFFRGMQGTTTWTWRNGRESKIGWFVGWDDWPALTIYYRWDNREDVRFSVRLQTTPTQFGGKRWWFTCPLNVDGVACNRRVGTLYLPPGAKLFGCRACHRLTYRSCQQAHKAERLDATVESIRRRLTALLGRWW